MIRRLAVGFLWAAGAYLLGAFGGGMLVNLLSANTHDRSIEAAMTGAFFFGPVAAAAGFVLGIWRSRPRAATVSAATDHTAAGGEAP